MFMYNSKTKYNDDRWCTLVLRFTILIWFSELHNLVNISSLTDLFVKLRLGCILYDIDSYYDIIYIPHFPMRRNAAPGVKFLIVSILDFRCGLTFNNFFISWLRRSCILQMISLPSARICSGGIQYSSL